MRGLSVAPIHENRTTPCAVGCLDIAPAVADEKAGGEVDPPAFRSGQQQARLRLAAIAAIGVVMEADRDLIQGQAVLQLAVHLFHGVGGESAPGDVGLVRDHDQDEPRCA